MLESILSKLKDQKSLTEEEMVSVMKEIMSGKIPHADIVSFLVLLRDKGETVEEVLGAARVMREFCVGAAPCGRPGQLIDTCGTGGDSKGTFNISTAAAFVVAGAGVPVAKHGNRSVSSRSGSADVLEALGVRIDLPGEKVFGCIKEAGIGFLFARRYHPAMKNVAEARSKIGTRTIFNLLGPLTNPAGAKRQLVGVFDRKWCRPLAFVLGKLGSERAMVVCGMDGMDEITLTGKTEVCEWKDGSASSYEIDPRDLGLALCDEKDLVGGDAKENAKILKVILMGGANDYLPLRNVVLLNAAAALVVAGAAGDFGEGLKAAGESLESGRAMGCLVKLIEVSNR